VLRTGCLNAAASAAALSYTTKVGEVVFRRTRM
jgi:hypothetical protein